MEMAVGGEFMMASVITGGMSKFIREWVWFETRKVSLTLSVDEAECESLSLDDVCSCCAEDLKARQQRRRDVST
jgi:hypothetical protein